MSSLYLMTVVPRANCFTQPFIPRRLVGAGVVLSLSHHPIEGKGKKSPADHLVLGV